MAQLRPLSSRTGRAVLGGDALGASNLPRNADFSVDNHVPRTFSGRAPQKFVVSLQKAITKSFGGGTGSFII
ncbi:hypothetical protein CRV24_005042 [Beauveria bassiana]|nr:hypothetical protein CRV24_005042 [Beauveria bassiana]KAH8711686.1 hypothetical protein HC256_008498 [Beauveria bassiana]